MRARRSMMATVRGLSAAGAAHLAAELIQAGELLTVVWRHCVLQLLDDYRSDLALVGIEAAQQRFFDEPAPSGSPKVDAALAALAEHLARRDRWDTPAWARDTGTYTREWWFVTPLRGMHATALQQSPPSFRKRGVFITAEALSRA